MSEIRDEYPFQISYEDARLPRSLVVLRAETAGELGQAYVDIQAALDAALGRPVVDSEASPVEPTADTPSPAQTSDSVAELPLEALKALMEQKKPIPCECKAGWWDNRVTKKSPKYPDFKCKKCGKSVWLTAYQEER